MRDRRPNENKKKKGGEDGGGGLPRQDKEPMTICAGWPVLPNADAPHPARRTPRWAESTVRASRTHRGRTLGETHHSTTAPNWGGARLETSMPSSHVLLHMHKAGLRSKPETIPAGTPSAQAPHRDRLNRHKTNSADFRECERSASQSCFPSEAQDELQPVATALPPPPRIGSHPIPTQAHKDRRRLHRLT